METLAACKPLPAVGSGVIDPVRMQMLHKMDLLKAHSLPIAEHSSDKSSQDRLSQLDAKTGGDGMDWSVAAAPVSSRLHAAQPALLLPAQPPAAPEAHEPVTRKSPRRVRLQTPQEAEHSSDSSRRNLSSPSDPAACLERGRLQEALSRKRNPAIAQQAMAKVSGETPEARACCARELAGSLASEAEQKGKRAAHLIAVAQRMATEAHRASKRRRVSHAPPPRLAPAGSCLVGARVAVHWAADGTFYKGVVAAEDEEADQHRIVYDDDAEEWLSLAEERFRLLAPRAASAGCDARLISHLESLQAEGLAPEPALPPRQLPAQRSTPPAGEAAVGWRLSLRCSADGLWHEAQVIGYRPAVGRHHLLYLDGEDEWAALGEEALQWHAPARAPLHAGVPPASGEEAVGWRVAVYWKADQKFYGGSIQGYDAAMGRHHVLYADGDEEHLLLAGEGLKWLGPPAGVKKAAAPAQRKSARAAKAQQSPQTAGAEREARRAPPPATPPKQPRAPLLLSHHSSRGSCGPRNGSMESVSAMLQRVEADEAALMHTVAAGTPLGLQPGSHLFVPAGLGSPLSSLEGGSSNGVSPAHPQPLLPFPDAATDEPPQGWSSDAKLLGWNLVGGGSPLRGCGLAVKPEIKSEPLPAFPSGLLAAPEASQGLLPAPSPAPLDSVLPPSFSADGSLLLTEPTSAALATPLAEAEAASPADLGSADLEMEMLLDIPGVEAAPTSWWQSM